MKSTPALEATIDHAYRAIEHSPEHLLEHDGGPAYMKADIIVARLIGLDDEIVDQFLVPEALPVWRVPVASRVSVMADGGSDSYAQLRSVDFVLQSNYATAWLSYELAPPEASHGPDFRCKVLCLRYKREPIHTSR